MNNATEGVVGAPDSPVDGDPGTEAVERDSSDEDLRTRYTRLSADLQNLRRRAEIERAELTRFGAEPLSRGLLPVLDNLRRALDAAAPTDPLVEEDTVTAELRPGYRLHQRVLRPAQVAVSRRPADRRS
jgi:molecular chaperone GrpE (heat shock protein)